MKENQFNSYSFLSPLHPFTPTIFPSPVTPVSRSPPHGDRFFPQSSPSTFSSPSISRRNKCAPTRIFKKAVSYPRSPHLHHHLHHLRLPTLARATASPPNTVVSRHSRAFSSSFFSASSPVPFLLFSHPYVSLIPSVKLRLPSKSLHTLLSLFSSFSLSLHLLSSLFFCYSSLRNGLGFHAFIFFPSRWLYSLLFLVFLIRRYVLCTYAEDERVRRTDLASEGKDAKKKTDFAARLTRIRSADSRIFADISRLRIIPQDEGLENGMSTCYPLKRVQCNRDEYDLMQNFQERNLLIAD